jgi:hypothetical protein
VTLRKALRFADQSTGELRESLPAVLAAIEQEAF